MEGLDRGQELLLRAILRRHRALLVEFAQVVKIIDAVPGIKGRGAFKGRRQPDRTDPLGLEIRCILLQADPQIIFKIHEPFKILKQYSCHFALPEATP